MWLKLIVHKIIYLKSMSRDGTATSSLQDPTHQLRNSMKALMKQSNPELT